MKNFWSNLKKWQKWGVALGFLATIAIIVISVFLIINAEPKVEIEFSEKTNIPSGELRNVRMSLVGAIRNNTESFDNNTVYKGIARDYKETKDGDLTTAEFVVDFDDISQSYVVSVTWPNPDDGAPNIYISCPLLDSKYPETPCTTESNSNSEIVNFLPHIGEFNSNEEYKIVAKYRGAEMYLEVQLDTLNDAKKDEALKAAKKWLFSIGFNPDNYTFEVSGGGIENDSLVFHNQDILTLAYNNKIAMIILDDISAAVYLNREIQSSANSFSETIATLNIDSFESFDSLTSKFEMDISDDRKYQLIVRADSLDNNFTYVYVAISKIDSSDIMIYATGDKKDLANFAEFAKIEMDKVSVEFR